MCLQFTVTVVLTHKNIGEDTQSITKIRSFVDQYE